MKPQPQGRVVGRGAHLLQGGVEGVLSVMARPGSARPP
jgi:hypothetical protein